MNKSAPSFGRIAAMVVFALSCFGLLLFLWLAFGGPVPLKPKGYRFTASFAEATQLSTEADVRISGVPVGKVKAIEPDNQTGRSDVTIELKAALRAAAVGRAGDPAPEDAARRDLRRAHAGHAQRAEGARGRIAARGPGVRHRRSSTRSSARSTPRRARRSWSGCRSRGAASAPYGRDVNDALGNLAPFAEDAARLVDILNRQQGAVTSLISNTGVVFDALSERDGQLRSLIQNSNRVFQATAARDEELKQTFMALPTFERESQQTLDRLAEFSQTTNPLVTQLRPAARELSPTLQDLGALSPDLKAFFQGLGPLIDASRTGFPAARAGAARRAPADRPARPGDAPAHADPPVPGALQARADGVLRQLGRGHAGEQLGR